ncbi:MAG: hypothetical protein J6A61_02115 [Clostridia bacterium]|nr:hypothetical protein [Clostridia bacterium]
MIVDRKNIDFFRDNSFHDYKVNDIVINYNNRLIKIELLYSDLVINFTCKGFQLFSLNCIEPWGSGIYIYDIEINQDHFKDDMISIKLILNSGDTILVITKEIDVE